MITATATSSGTAAPGALHAGIAAQGQLDGPSSAVAGGVVNAGRRDTITPAGPGGSGTFADFNVTFAMAGSILVSDIGFNGCAVGGPVASVVADLTGPISLGGQLTDCPGSVTTQTVKVSLEVGVPDGFDATISAGVKNMAGKAAVNFGASYLSPSAVPEPSTFALLVTGLAVLCRRLPRGRPR